ncbi:hypothetical protein BGZ74_000448 [Mortierella antarctica]|nr:hypothetical protein BGZ74_000448 [Mortierella antarctica]
MNSNDALAVLECNGLLELVLPVDYRFDPYTAGFSLRHFPTVKSLSFWKMMGLGVGRHPFLTNILTDLPNLQHVDMDCGHASGRKVSSILHDPRLQLSSVTLRHVEPYFSPLVLRPLLLPQPAGENATRRHFLRHTLVRLTAVTAYRPYAMSDLILLLANCPNLQHVEVCNIAVDASQQSHGKLQGDAAMKTVELFMAQLGDQTLLRELSIYFDYETPSCGRPMPFPAMALTLEVHYGLSQLSRLSNLESFVMMGIFHRLQCRGQEWMAAHWPWLRYLGLSPLAFDRVLGSLSLEDYKAGLTRDRPALAKWSVDLNDRMVEFDTRDLNCL